MEIKPFSFLDGKAEVPKKKKKIIKKEHKYDKTKFDFARTQLEAINELPKDLVPVQNTTEIKLAKAYRDISNNIPSQERANANITNKTKLDAHKEATYSYVKVEAVREIDEYSTFIYESKEILMTPEDMLAFNKDDDLEMQNAAHVFPTTGLGIVVYMDKERYSPDFEENSNIHFKFDKESMLRLLFHLFTQTYSIREEDIKNICVGHEHGGKKNKCHFQCCVFFKTQIKRNWHPAIFKYKQEKCLIMFQKSRKPYALRNYVKKDKDFCFLHHDEQIFPVAQKRTKTGDWQIDMARTMQINMGRDPIALKAYLFQRNPTWFLANCYGINKTIEMLGDETLPDFRWIILPHLRSSTNPKHIAIVNHIDTWFVPENVSTVNMRRKGLVLFGDQNVGKTRFAQGLVPHSSYYTYVRSGFSQASIKTISTTRLLILDDLEHFSNQLEQYKAILSGEPTQVREAYINVDLPGLPCILLTNKIQLATFIYNHPLLKNRCTIVKLTSSDYLGPPNTQQRAFEEPEHYVDDEFISYAQLKQQEYTLKIENAKQDKLLSKKTNRKEEINNLDEKDLEIKRLKDAIEQEKIERLKWEQVLNESYKKKILEFKLNNK